MNGPLSPEELERMQAYYGGSPGQNMSSANAPPPAASAAPAPEEPSAAYWGLPSKAIPAGAPPPTGLPEPPPEPQIDKYGNPLTAAQVTTPPLIGGGAQAPAAPSGPTTIPEVTVQSALPPNAMMRQPGVLPAPYREIESRTAAAEKPKGGPGNPDPFGVKAANTALLGTYNDQKSSIERQGAAEGAKAVQHAEGMEQLSRTMVEDAAIDRAQQEMADAQFADHMTEVQRQIDDLREKKIDPTRRLKDKGIGILSIVAGIAGGLYQGINHLQSNPFLDDLHRTINDDMRAQEDDLNSGRAAVADQLNLLGQMRAVYKDKQLADMQARNLIYEATKQGIEAEASRGDDVIIKERAAQAVAVVSREQAMLQKQIAEQARAQAAAAAAQQFAQMKAARERLDGIFQTTYDKALAAGLPPEKAEYEARRMVQTLMTQGGPGPRPASNEGASADPLANVPKAQQEHAAKELEAKSQADSGKAALEDAFRKYAALPATAGPYDRERVALRAAMMGAYKQSLGPGMSSDKDAETFLEPLMPNYGSSDEVNAKKLDLIKAQIDSKVATPILDRHNPGWKGPPPVKHYDASGKPK